MVVCTRYALERVMHILLRLTNSPERVLFNDEERCPEKNVLPKLVITVMPRTTTKSNNPRVFEEAREAVIKLQTLSRVLTRAELETLELLFDKHAMAIIAKSLQEAEGGRYEPITSIR
jgi:hypothetical protein